MTGPLLHVQNLTIGIPGAQTTLVRNINFSLDQGQVLGLAGQSGSGKTLCAGALAGLLPVPVSILGGDIQFQGHPLYAAGPRGKPRYCGARGREVLFLFQSPLGALDPCVKCRIQIADAIKQATACSAHTAGLKASEALARVGLGPDRFDSFPFELSGGQRQRVLMAMAFGLRPRLLIADEPTSGQDHQNQEILISLMADLVAEAGTSVMIISHDLRVLDRLTHHVVVLFQGCQVESGPPAQLFSQPNHDHTRELVRAMAYLKAFE